MKQQLLRLWVSAATVTVADDARRDEGAITEETAIRVILVGAAIAAGTTIAGLIAANAGAIPSPG